MEINTAIPMIAGGIILIIVIIYLICMQKDKVKEWLLYAVTEAEKALGEKTGQLKLAMVYEWFTDKFPIFAAILPFKVFSAWVDTALVTLENWFKNKHIAEYVTGGSEENNADKSD